jgi:hypothetical protein
VRWAVLGAIPLWIIGVVLTGTVRSVVGVVDTAWTVVLLVSVARDPSHRGIHDRMADTAVVVAPQ